MTRAGTPLKREFFKEKIRLVTRAMEEAGIDLWITFTREGNEDPMADDLGLHDVTWRSACILEAGGELHAVVGNLDAETVRRRGVYGSVDAYGKEGAAPRLYEIVSKLGPKRIAVNTSHDFGLADGLSPGMGDYLRTSLKEYGRRLVSSEGLVTAFRARLVPGELRLLRTSIEKCEEIYDAAQEDLIKAGRTDRQIHEGMQRIMADAGVEPAWGEDHCPSVTIGSTPAGHTGYHGDRARRGGFVHIDFGVRFEGYCSDIQRVYFLGESVPADVGRMFRAARESNDAGIEALRPGVSGWVVDKACRDVVVRRGYPEFMHATGHVLGRATHEIGPLLGPRWPERYGRSSEKAVGEGMVFTIEPSVEGEKGTCNLEQDVLVTRGGVELLSKQQDEIIQL